MFTLLIAAMRMKSAARDRKHANVEGNGMAPRAVLPSAECHTLALACPRQDHRGLPLGAPSLGQRVENRRQVVPVDDDGVPAEGAPATGELLHVVLPHGGPALTERIHVRDAAQV